MKRGKRYNIVKRNIDLKIIPEKISIPITELKKYNNLNFIPLVNGLEIDVEEFKTWKIEIETDLKMEVVWCPVSARAFSLHNKKLEVQHDYY